MSYPSTLSVPRSLRYAIEQQLEKMFLDPLFAESRILKRFLSFIVNETLEGRSDQLKEYTIAVDALEKPRNFRPHENAIVRIHAGRLRRILNHYYRESGAMDNIRIYVPKGKYVPVISERKDNNIKQLVDNDNCEPGETTKPNHATTFSVMPFQHLTDDPTLHSFSEGLCMGLTKELMQVKNASVICYQAVQSLSQKVSDFDEMLAKLGTDYLIAGNIQFMTGNLRVNVQIIRSSSRRQIWSKSYERKLAPSNMFNLVDEISRLVVSQVREVFEFNRVAIIPPVRLAAV